MLLVTGRFATVELVSGILESLGIPCRLDEGYGGVVIHTGVITSGAKFTIMDELANYNLEVDELNV